MDIQVQDVLNIQETHTHNLHRLVLAKVKMIKFSYVDIISLKKNDVPLLVGRQNVIPIAPSLKSSYVEDIYLVQFHMYKQLRPVLQGYSYNCNISNSKLISVTIILCMQIYNQMIEKFLNFKKRGMGIESESMQTSYRSKSIETS